MYSEKVLTREKAMLALSRNVGIMEAVVETLTQKEAILLRDGDGGWNTIEILCHLGDFEAIFQERLRQTAEGTGATYTVYDADERVRTQNYDARTLDEALLWWVEGRHETVAYLRGLTADQWAHTGLHPENGPMSVYDHAYHIICHDINHMDQILKAVG